jgi:asparagine synthase (glutamine-hydrolysing)
MPGLHFVADWRGRIAGRRSAIRASLDALRHSDAYVTSVLAEDDFHLLARSGYGEYPVARYETNGVVVFLEGRLYGLTEADRDAKLEQLVALTFDGVPDHDRLREWLLSVDGDFVAFLLQPGTGEIRILNDVFGRLPVYHCQSGSGLVVSRELRFATRLLDRIAFDRLALAQSLWLGYPLGERTLIDGLERLPPGSLIRSNTRRGGTRLERLHCLNLEPKAHARIALPENAAHLVELFSTACEARRDPGTASVLSLSGGFDSRAVGASLARLDIPFRCATYLDHAGNAAPDVPIAQQLAALFAVPWDLHRLGPPGSRDVVQLLRMKSGMNPLGMAYLLPFLEAVRRSAPGPIALITGEMGTGTMKDLRPARVIGTPRDLVAYIDAESHRLPLEDVASVTGIPAGDLAAELERHVIAYPESDCAQKYAHFFVRERLFNWHGEADDRNRCYLWTTSPFHGSRFFQAAIACPDEQKAHYRLYREILTRLSPAAAAIPHAGLGAAITSRRFETVSRVAALLGARPQSREALALRLGFVDGYGQGSTVVRCLRQQMATCGPLAEYLVPVSLARIVDASARYTREQFDYLFTITSIIEDLTTGTTTLERQL